MILLYLIFITNYDNILQPNSKIIFNKLNNLNFTLFEFSKHPQSIQPDGSIKDNYYFIQAFQPFRLLKATNESLKNNYLIENPQIIYFKKIYKPHTNFVLDKLNNKETNFNKTFQWSPLNDLCYTNYERDNANFCLKYNPNNWDCIYESCISISRPQIHYIKYNISIK